MATGLVVHISSGEDRHTEILTDERVRIGTLEDCDLRLRASSLPRGVNGSVVLELLREGSSYRIASVDPGLSLLKNGNPISNGASLNDGDEIRIEDSELLMQFFPHSLAARCCASISAR